MSVTNAAVSVGTSATALNAGMIAAGHSAAGPTGVSVDIYNDGSSTIFIGGPAVTTSGGTKGRPITASTSISLDLRPGEIVYGIVASGTVSAIVTATGVGP